MLQWRCEQKFDVKNPVGEMAFSCELLSPLLLKLDAVVHMEAGTPRVCAMILCNYYYVGVYYQNSIYIIMVKSRSILYI